MKLKKYLFETAKYALRSYPVIYFYIREVERLYAMSVEELNKRNEEKFLKIFRKAYDKSPFYHKLYAEADIRKEDITCLADIKKLPVITKDIVKKHADEMLTVPRKLMIAANTSGTTGTPLKIYESWPSIWLSQAYTYCARRRNGFTYGQPLVSLRGNLDKSQIYLKVHINNTLYLSSYNINQRTVKLYHDLIIKHKPVAIEGYPSSLYSLALFLKDAGLKQNVPVAFTSSETLLDYQRKLIEEQLGTEIYDNYGMTEMTIYLQEAYNHQGYYEMPGYSINEYVEDGEICTSLINESFPMIRYRSNDIIEMAKATEENPQIVVQRVVGRVDDYVVCKDGSMVTRIAFIKSGKCIKACQWIQEEKGKVIICIVPDDGFTEQDRLFVVNETRKRVGDGNMDIETRLVTIEQLVYSRRGKFKLIVNLMR